MTDQPDNPVNSNEILVTEQENRSLVASIAPRGERAPILRETAFESLSAQVIPHALTFDSRGRLWGGGFGGAICWEISRNQVKYQTFHAEHGLAGHDVSAIYATGSHVLFGHRSGYISSVDVTLHKWTTAPYRAPARVLALFEHDGAVCAVTSRGLFNIETNEMHHTSFYPLTAITASGQIWVGAADGLWTFVNDQWVCIEKCDSVRCVTYARGSIWFAGNHGLSMVLPDGKQTHQVNALPVVALSPVSEDNTLYVLTVNNGLIRIEDKIEGGKKKTSPTPVTWYTGENATHLVASRDVVACGTQTTLTCKMTDVNQPMRLTPDSRDNLPQIQSIFVADDQHYAQAVNGTLWRQSESGWREVPSKVPMGEVMGVTTQTKTDVLIGMTGRFPLIAMGGDAMLDSIESPFTHIQAFNGNGQAIAAKPDDKRVLTLYHCRMMTGDDGAQWQVVHPATADDLTKISGGMNGSQLVYDGEQITVHANTPHSSVLPVGLPGEVTALGVINDTMLIGTTRGLWQVTIGENDKTQFDITHGLPGRAILQIVPVSKQEALIVTSGGITRMRTAM